MKRTTIIKGILLCFGIMMCFVCGNSVYARDTETAIQKRIVDKSIYQGVYKCYNNGFLKNDLVLKDYDSMKSLMADNANDDENYVPLVSGSHASGAMDAFFGNGLRYDVEDDGLSCYQLFVGGDYTFGGSNKSILAATGHEAPKKSSTDSVRQFFEGMGYTIEKGDSGKQCFVATYYGDVKKSKAYQSNKVCLDGAGNVSVEGGEAMDQVVFYLDDKNPSNVCLKVAVIDDAWFGEGPSYRSMPNCAPFTTANEDGFMDTITTICGKKGKDGNIEKSSKCVASNAGWDTTYEFESKKDSVIQQDSIDGDKATWINNSGSDAGLQAVKYLSGTDYTADSIKVTEPEKRMLYQAYLTSYYNVEVNCDDGETDSAWDGKLTWFDAGSGAMKECHYRLNHSDSSKKKTGDSRANNKVNGIGGDGYFAYNSIDGRSRLIEEIKALPSDYSEEEMKEMSDISRDELERDPQDGEDDCLSQKGAGSLGWIVCPLLKWMSDAATQTYEDYVAPSLQIEPTLFNGGGGDNVKTAWGTFRDIANVLFIILFLVVIFSQLTGIGIDNYGIKKILPRLIVAAIMINLSYIICILLVDLSNILGNGLKGIFDALGAQLNPVVDFTADGAESSGGSVSGVLASVGVLAAVGVMVGAIWANPAILLSLLVGALGVIVSIFFLFILLAARKAAVIVLTVISPLAVVAYMLPNTKKLFDKWWKFFEGLLLVYPIAGLLVGGGDYISRLLLGTSTGFLTGLTAMIVGIVPIFFIPTVLKGAFAAMGKVGGMLTGLGTAARGKVTGAARGTDAYKNLQNRGLERRTRLRAGIDANGRAKKLSGAGVLLRGGRRNVAAARASYDKTQGERIREDMWMDPQYTANRAKYRETAASNEREKMYSDLFASRDRNTNVSELRSALTGTDAEKASAALSTLESQGGISEALSELSGADWSKMNAGVRSRLIQTMGASKVDAMKSYSKYLATGGGAGFKDWASGNISAQQLTDEAKAGVKDGTYAQHLLDGGENAMAGYSKDEMQFIQGNADAIRKEMENRAVANGGTAADGKNEFGTMLKNTAINSNDAKAQTIAENTISSQLESGGLDVDHLGITSENIGNMRGKTAEALVKGMEGMYYNSIKSSSPGITEAAARTQARSDAQNYIRANLNTQIQGARADSMIASKTRNDTKAVLGM